MSASSIVSQIQDILTMKQFSGSDMSASNTLIWIYLIYGSYEIISKIDKGLSNNNEAVVKLIRKGLKSKQSS